MSTGSARSASSIRPAASAEPGPDSAPGSAPAPPLLEARDIHRAFGTTQALRGATVSVHRGEILAIMGPSGSGKSTLLHCFAGIYKPDQGEVWFDGTRVDTLS